MDNRSAAKLLLKEEKSPSITQNPDTLPLERQIDIDLASFKGSAINDKDLRACFLENANAIVAYYENLKLPLGNIKHYIEGLKVASDYLDRVKGSFSAKASLLRQGVSYIYHKLKGGEVELEGELGDAIAIIKKYNQPESGKIPLFQVNCDAKGIFYACF